MIWYLLYPLRGTTEPPRLSPSHPLRRAFQAHGTATARHWLLSLVLTITISVLLCYQAVFQTDSPAAASLRNLPKHVWTSTTEIEGERPADVVVRQVWVHGDYMKAIELPVLREAMHVQDALIGSGFAEEEDGALAAQSVVARDSPGCLAAAAGENWGYHSPLMYWDCSLEALENDQDLLTTINSRATAQSALNMTLRPSSLFAGKTFSNTKLRAADALVFTVFDQTDSGLGHVWDARSRLLAERTSPNWTVFPKSGQVTSSRLYEFHFKPMTLIDDLILAASYIVTAVYVISRMMQLRAVKSWFGLLVTICAKMTICIIASFTLCTYLGINLTHIPRPWFPAVVFCFGLGNIFRLTNSVLQTPPEMPPHQRIGNALGEVGHMSLAVAFQNLALLYLCSRLVSPWVADFCVFAAVTLVFDFVYHLTFFVAVLSVDVQRMELSDSLDRVDLVQRATKPRPERQSWLAALREGTLPLSTRFAGSVAIFSIILAINWHFFDTNDKPLTLRTLRQKFMSKARKRSMDGTWSPPPINQARTPADWLRIQDHNTARELFGFIKPGSHSFVARIYDPLLVVSKGAYGRDRPQPPTSFSEGFLRFAHGHAFPAALIVVFLIAGVTLFMNYLLWTGLPETMDERKEEEEATFSVKTLSTPHTLDIVRLVSCSKGHMSSISLDRSTSVWLNSRRGYMHTILQTATMNPKLWPIQATTMDDTGNYLALCTNTGQLGLWSMNSSRFTMFSKVDIRGQVPVLFSFVGIPRGGTEKAYIVIISPDGYLTEWDVCSGIQLNKRICSSTIVCATLYTSVKGVTSLVFVTKPGEVHISPLEGDGSPASEVVAGLDPGPPPGSNPAKIKCIQGVPSLGLIFALRDEEAEIFDFSSRALIHSFQIGHVKPHSFRVMHASRRSCPCGAPAVHSLSVAYSEQETEHMIMQTFALDDSSTSQVCLGKPSDREKFNCKGLDCAIEAVHYVEPAGVWESTGVSSVIGIRRNNPSPTPSSTTSGADDDHYTADPAALASALKQRARKHSIPDLPSRFGNRASTHAPTSDSDAWEAWTLSSSGEFRSRPLCPDDPDDPTAVFQDDLFVASPGPITRLGKRSVAVGFGNTVKIISLGKEVFQGLTSIENGTLENRLGSYNGRVRRGTPRKIQ